ncbi:AMP-binding protein [Aliiglaciecola sp. 2_MG-2023]|uniref:AMP-binding protein n=1 Tax=unclassified Aliiglaciecola TaxID=2593648 RepID=UPI0026E216B0|nr:MULTISPECIES: AMP-binding protein [unclassified Aliiglaciecola]MDO6709359.1 AMP-binding protein [Aliiglaciecola sp. 2_MG-2023]MDO6750507.1 AMP-binding protein [Aliiglaciecola sp. 1_MG-2023]
MFYDALSQHANNIAAIEGEQQLSYAQLEQACRRLEGDLSQHLGRRKGVIFIMAFNGLSTLVAYLSALRQGHCAMLLSPDTAASDLQNLYEQFAPTVTISCEAKQQTTIQYHQSRTSLTHCMANLLLSTSGSTGTAKQVALSADNLQSNADAICDYLPIKSSDKTLCSLPFFYSYGLSIINSHLNKGACCVFTDASPVSRDYWQLFEEHQISSFAGVPFTYEMLLRLRFHQKKLPHLRYFTQAGGKLNVDAVKTLGEFAENNQSQFFVMYGQTEASPRMAFLHPDLVLQKPESIGCAIPGGRFKLVDEQNQIIEQANSVGELFYTGPNVMLGYVCNITDLNALSADSSQSKNAWLATGDLAYFDEDGDYFIAGRKSRFLKLFGLRIDLDEVERKLLELGITGLTTGNDNYLVIGTTALSIEQSANDVKGRISQLLDLHPSVIKVIHLDVLPLTENGKKDYQAVLKLGLQKSS